MTVSTLMTPVGVTATTGLTDLGSAVATAHDQNVNVRCCNVGAAGAYGDLAMVNGATVIYLVKNYFVDYQDAGSAVDLILGHLLPAGWKLQCRASAGSTLSFCLTGIDRG
jgi:hypothetical protein